MRLKTISDSLSSGMAKVQEDQARIYRSYNQNIMKLRKLTERTDRTLVDRQRTSVGQGYHDCVVATGDQNWAQHIWEPSQGLRDQTTTTAITTTCVSDLQQLIPSHCTCNSHEQYSKRSPRVADRIIGTLFAGYSDVSYLICFCNKLSGARSCANSHFMFSLTYFFPLWILSCAIILRIQKHMWGFDFNLRVIRYVSYSSPIFQYAYQGDVLGMKGLLRRRLGSPFDVTSEPQRTLLGVWLPFAHTHFH